MKLVVREGRWQRERSAELQFQYAGRAKRGWVCASISLQPKMASPAESMEEVVGVGVNAVKEETSGAVVAEGASSATADAGGTSAPPTSSSSPAEAAAVCEPAPGEDLTKVWVP